jgi:hypothetical protein
MPSMHARASPLCSKTSPAMGLVPSSWRRPIGSPATSSCRRRGIAWGKGIEIIAADSPTAFVDDTPTATFVRQVLGAVAQLDKARVIRGKARTRRHLYRWVAGRRPEQLQYGAA